MELWHAPDARSFRVLWAMEELGLPCELHLLPFPPRAHAPDYLDVNPLGTVPAFRDGETFMTESVAIIQYLAARHDPDGLGVRIDDAAYGEWLNWLHFGEATLTFPLTLVLRYRQFEPGRAEIVAEDYARWFMSRLRYPEAVLADREWLVADRFTAADISVGYALLLSDYLGLSPYWKENTARYWDRLHARKGFKAAKARQKVNLNQLLGEFGPSEK
jgi:glutathione S-transferase